MSVNILLSWVVLATALSATVGYTQPAPTGGTPMSGTPAVAPLIPTKADIETLYSAGQYKLALQQGSRMLAGAPPETRAELFYLRAQCLLKLDDPASARRALNLAEKEAAKCPPTEALKTLAARARADGILIEASKAGTVAIPGAQAVSISDDAARPALYAALLNLRMNTYKGDLDRAANATDLPKIFGVLPKVYDLYSLELAATGKDEQILAVYRSLGVRARLLIDQELTTQEAKVTSIRNSSEQIEGYGGARLTGTAWAGVAVRRGLWTADREALRQTLDQLERIMQTCEQAIAYATSHGVQPVGWDELMARTKQLGELAQATLDGE